MTALWVAVSALVVLTLFLALWVNNLDSKVARMTWGGDGRVPGGE